MSAYYLEHANVDHIQRNFEIFEQEACSLLSLSHAIPAQAFPSGLESLLMYFISCVLNFVIKILIVKMNDDFTYISLGMTCF